MSGPAPAGPLPVPLPPLEALLLRTRAEALAALQRAGWRRWGGPLRLDAGRSRLLNVDLTEPEAFFGTGGAVAAVAHVETDREGLVTHVEITAASPADPAALAAAWLHEPGPPRVGGGEAAREWVWGPESGGSACVAGEPVRLWVCSERAYGGRLWAVATVVRRSG